jgi:hypothetical protein
VFWLRLGQPLQPRMHPFVARQSLHIGMAAAGGGEAPGPPTRISTPRSSPTAPTCRVRPCTRPQGLSIALSHQAQPGAEAPQHSLVGDARQQCRRQGCEPAAVRRTRSRGRRAKSGWRPLQKARCGDS